MKSNIKLAMILAVNVAVLAGCSGGGGGNSGTNDSSAVSNGSFNTTAAMRDAQAAEIDASNLDVLVTAATEGAAQAISGDAPGLPSVGIASAGKPQAIASDGMRSVATQSSSIAQTERYAGSCGGEYRAEFPDNYRGGNFTAKVVYDNYCEGSGGYQLIFDGTQTVNADFYSSDQTSGKYVTYYDLTVSSNWEMFETTRIRGWQECRFDNNADAYDCDEAHDYVTSNGRYYQVSDAQVTGNEYEGYNVSARVVDEEYGYVTINASNLIQCQNGGFSSGAILIADASAAGVVEISFSNCDSFAVTYQGVSETFTF